MAGLLAVRVLLEHFDHVTLVDRDQFLDAADSRAGVPQGRHPHVLLARGQQILEQLFPGLDCELATAGAPEVDAAADWIVLLPAGWAPRYRSGIRQRTCSRPLLESTIRRRLVANPNVHVLARHEVTGLLAAGAGTSVVGVRLRCRQPAGDRTSPQERLAADLVVDASGRDSHLPQWLATLGYASPVETIITAHVGYASRWYRCSATSQFPWKAMLLSSRAPHQTRMGVIFPIEGDRQQIGLAGMAQDYPPTDEEGWLAFARSLRSPLLYAAIQASQPLTPIYGYRRTQNRLRHYERLARWPDGLVVLGDAVCAFNPIYGQGMTVAALGAQALDRCLRARAGRSAGLGRWFQRELARVNAVPWLMATGEDFRWPRTVGGRPGRVTRLMHAYLDQVQHVATRRPNVHCTYVEVIHLLRSPRVLFRPTILLPVAGQISGRAWRHGRSVLVQHPAWRAARRVVTRWAVRSPRGRQ